MAEQEMQRVDLQHFTELLVGRQRMTRRFDWDEGICVLRNEEDGSECFIEIAALREQGVYRVLEPDASAS